MIRRRGLFLAGALLSILCGSPPADGAPAEPVPGYCDINVVFGPLVTGGHVAVIGFAVDETDGAPVRKIELTLDGSIHGEASLMGLRPDVLAHFARQDYLWAGWKATASLDGVPPGTHSVDIVAVTHRGKTIPCGTRKFEVSPGLELPRPRARLIALRILLRAALFFLWIILIGLAPAAAMPGALRFLSAPFLGLAGFSALFAIIGVLPFALHGEGAVLGDIDDASRECVVADSISQYGWSVPPDVAGYLATMRREIEAHHVRPGGIYLLSALADAFGVRSYEIH